MTINRTHAAAFLCAIALALAAPQLSAQTSQPAERPVPEAPRSPEIQVPAERPIGPPDDRFEEFRYYRPVVRVGQNYALKQGEEVREVRTVFGDVLLEGRVTGDVVSVLGTVHVTSTAVIEGALVVVAGTAVIDDGAAVHGDLVVAGGTLDAPPSFRPGGDHIVVGTPGLGPALHGVVPWITRGLLWGRIIVPELRWMWVVVGIFFLIGLLLNTLFDRAVGSCADVIVQRPLSAFLLGLLVAVLTVPAIAILAATVIGLVVVPFVVCALVIAGIIGRVGVARAIGRGILHPETPEQRLLSLATFVLGFAVLVFIYMVPVIGVLTWALVGVIGLGAAASTFRAGLRREQPARRAAAVPTPVATEPVAAAAPVVEAPPIYATDAGGAATAAVPPLEIQAPAVPPPAVVAAGDLALYPRATFLDRLAAFAVDCLLVGISVQMLNLSREDGAFPMLLLIYHVAFWAWKGTTLGGIICAVRVVRTSGTELRFVDAVVRGLSAILSIFALGIGCFWMLQDPESQMWHDKIAGTLVVKVPRQMAVP